MENNCKNEEESEKRRRMWPFVATSHPNPKNEEEEGRLTS
jgi:hypothetical protein